MIWLKRIGLIVLIICLGTVIDYIVHQINPVFSVPSTYFPHKIYYGVLWAFVGYLVFRKYVKTPLGIAIAMSAVPAVLLQTMYFIQKTQMNWVILFFLFGHFLMFLLPSYFICKRFKDLFIDNLPPAV